MYVQGVIKRPDVRVVEKIFSLRPSPVNTITNYTYTIGTFFLTLSKICFCIGPFTNTRYNHQDDFAHPQEGYFCRK